jgi:ribonuclease HI
MVALKVKWKKALPTAQRHNYWQLGHAEERTLYVERVREFLQANTVKNISENLQHSAVIKNQHSTQNQHKKQTKYQNQNKNQKSTSTNRFEGLLDAQLTGDVVTDTDEDEPQWVVLREAITHAAKKIRPYVAPKFHAAVAWLEACATAHECSTTIGLQTRHPKCVKYFMDEFPLQNIEMSKDQYCRLRDANRRACGQSKKESLEEEIRRHRDLYRVLRTPAAFEMLNSTQKDLMQEICDETAQRLEHDLLRRPGAAFRAVEHMTGGVRRQLAVDGETDAERLEVLKAYFKRLGGDKGGDPSVTFEAVEEVPVFNCRPIRLEEIQAAAKCFQRGKAAGHDRVPIEAIAPLLDDDETARYVVTLFNRMMHTGRAEDCLKKILQVPIPKKGDTTLIENWRPICLVNSIMKLYHRVLYERLVPLVDPLMRPNQFGFRPNRSTVGAQMTLAEIVTKAKRHKVPLDVCFVDFSKAFPSISFASIRAALKAYHVPELLIRAIMAVYDHPTAMVSSQYGVTDEFDVETGTMQGDVLAPFLFVLVLDRVLHKAMSQEKRWGLEIFRARGTKSRPVDDGTYITDIGYADDLVLLGHGTAEIQRMLRSLEACALEVNLKLNVGVAKTAVMSVVRTPDMNTVITLSDGRVVPRVSGYKYLGKQMEDGVFLDSNDRIQLGWYAVSKYRKLWSMSILPSTKLRFFNAAIYPIVTYASACVVLSATNANALDQAVSNMRRTVARCGKDTNLRALYAGTHKASTMMAVQRANAVGHLARQGMQTPYYYALLWHSDEEARYRLRTPSEACAEALRLEHGVGLVEAAQNRRRWSDRIDGMVHELEPRAGCALVDAVQWWKLCELHHDSPTDLQFVEEGRRPFTQHWAGVLHAYTDGSLLEHDGGKQGAGYGGVVFGDGHYEEFVVPLLRCEDMSNNRAELLAVLHACELARCTGRRLFVHTDSLLVWNFVQYQRRELRLSRYTHVPNGDILMKLDQTLSAMKDVVCYKVRAHNGNIHNDKADVLAGMASQQSYFVRHKLLPPAPSGVWGVGARGEPLPAWRKPIEVLAVEKRRLVEAQKQARKIVRRPPLTEAAMKSWFQSTPTGSAVTVTWAYEDEPHDVHVDEGVVVLDRRRRMIAYGESIGTQPFPPIAGVEVYVAEVVHPGTSPPVSSTGQKPGLR